MQDGIYGNPCLSKKENDFFKVLNQEAWFKSRNYADYYFQSLIRNWLNHIKKLAFEPVRQSSMDGKIIQHT